MLDEFLKQSGLTFKEYLEWFSSLKKGDRVAQYGISTPSLIDRAIPLKIKFFLDQGFYKLEDTTIFYITLFDKFQADNFPIPSEKEIKLIKEKRSQNLWLRIGEIYEDSDGVEWTVNYTDVPFSVTGSFPCECSNPDKGIRYYTSEGKFAGKPHPFDLIKKKERQMPIEESSKALEQSSALSIGQIWENENQKEMTVVSWDEDLCKFFLVAEDGSGVWVVPSGYESWSNKKHAVKYLGETKRPRLEVGKSYYKSDGELVILVKYDNSDDTYLGDDCAWYYQFGFKAFHRNGSKEDLVEEVVSLKVGQIYENRRGEEWIVMSLVDKKNPESYFRFICQSLSQNISYCFSENGRFAPSMNEHGLDLVKLVKDIEEGTTMPTEEIIKVEVIDEFAEVDSFFQSVKNNKLELKSLKEENESLKSDLAKTVYDRNEMGEQLGLEMSKNQDLLKKQAQFQNPSLSEKHELDLQDLRYSYSVLVASLFQAEIKTLEESKQVQETKYGKVCAENYELRQIIKRLEDHCDHLQKQVGICLKQEFVLLETKRTLENDILALTAENVRLAKKLKALETILEPDHK